MCVFINAQENRRIDRQFHIRTSGKESIVDVHACPEITEADGCRYRCLRCARAVQSESFTPFTCPGPSGFIDGVISNRPGWADQRERCSQARKSRRRRFHVTFLPDGELLATCRLDTSNGCEHLGRGSIRGLCGLKGEQKSTILLHPAGAHGLGNRALKFCACRVEQHVILVVVRLWDHGFDRRPCGTHPGVQRGQEANVKIAIVERRMSLSLIDGRRCFNRLEECCIEDCSLTEVPRGIRQTQAGSLAQSLQFVWFRESLSSA